MGTDHSGEDQARFSHADRSTDGADTTDSGSAVNRTDGTAEASDDTAGIDQAGTVRVVSMAMHTASDMGSRSTQPTGPSQPHVQQQPVTQNCHTGEDPDRAMKTLPVQPSVSAPDRNMAVPPVSVPMMAGLHNSASTTVPSTGMDV